jgi:oligosaccharide repeat unit polymerase
MRYLKSVDFPIHLMAYWWLLWIGISCTSLNQFLQPSPAALAQYLLLVGSFLLGHLCMKRLRPYKVQTSSTGTRGLKLGATRVRWVLGLAAFGTLFTLVLSLYLAGAFEDSFVEYFTRVRLLVGDDVPEATGIHLLDVLTKILAFPVAYAVLVTTLAVELSGVRKMFFACLASFLCYSYLWQINYAVIHLFWIMVFYALLSVQRRGQLNRKMLVVAAVLCVGLVASAANRFGGDVIGGLQRYIIGYHLLGFSFYDQQYLNPDSLLHVPSYGRSSLGFLELLLENVLKPFSVEFQAASSANSDFTNTAIDIGANDTMDFNAFGTLVFTFYRDLNVVGIFVGGALYGAAVTNARYRSHVSWRHGALFFMLASAWMMGMMVSPLESAYFWFVVVALGLLQIANRGVRWRSAQAVPAT